MKHKSALNESLMKIYHDVNMRWRGVRCLRYLRFVIPAVSESTIVITQVSAVQSGFTIKNNEWTEKLSRPSPKRFTPAGAIQWVFRELNN